MEKPPTILENTSRRPPWRARIDSIASWLRWLCIERQLTAVEVVFGGWVLFAISYVFFAAGFIGGQQSLVLMLSAMVAGSVAMLLASVHLLIARRFALSLLLVMMALVSSFIGGIIQFDRCPHATYVQIVGVSIPVSGDACHNPRQTKPWWMR